MQDEIKGSLVTEDATQSLSNGISNRGWGRGARTGGWKGPPTRAKINTLPSTKVNAKSKARPDPPLYLLHHPIPTHVATPDPLPHPISPHVTRQSHLLTRQSHYLTRQSHHLTSCPTVSHRIPPHPVQTHSVPSRRVPPHRPHDSDLVPSRIRGHVPLLMTAARAVSTSKSQPQKTQLKTQRRRSRRF